MGDEAALDDEEADADHPLVPVLDVEGLGGEAGLGQEAVKPVGETGGRENPQSPRWLELVAQVVAQGHDVDEVVGVQVADDHRAQHARLEAPGQPGEPALAKVQADAIVAVGHDVCAGRGAGAVRIGGAGPDDKELHGAEGTGFAPIGARAVGARAVGARAVVARAVGGVLRRVSPDTSTPGPALRAYQGPPGTDRCGRATTSAPLGGPEWLGSLGLRPEY